MLNHASQEEIIRFDLVTNLPDSVNPLIQLMLNFELTNNSKHGKQKRIISKQAAHRTSYRR